MRTRICACLLLVLALAASAVAQISRITLAAGSPEDKALQAIANEADATKRLAQYQEFVQQYAAEPQAVAYAYSQMQQLAQASGDLPGALAYGDKGLAAVPGNMELIVAQITVAQQMKDVSKVLDYAEMAAKIYGGIDTQAKPAGMSDEDFASHNANDKAEAQPAYQYAESAAFNAAANGSDAKQKVAALERFTAAFPDSQFTDQAAELVIIGYQQSNQHAKMEAFGEKLLARKPNSIPTLILLADAYVEDTKNLAKSLEYAQKALKLATADPTNSDQQKQVLAASAKSIIGYGYLRQEKYAAAVPELQAAAPVLKDNASAYSAVLYRLGFAYAKLKKYPEARRTLEQAIALNGPYTEMSKDLMSKLPGGAARRRR